MERRVFLGLSAAAIASIGSGAALAQSGDTTLTGAVTKLADLLETGYVMPDVGKRYAGMLRAKQAAGAYAGIADLLELGDRITADLQAVARDRHLRVIPEAMLSPDRRPKPKPATGTAAPKPPTPAGPPPQRRAIIEDAGWIAKDVAYIRFVGFPDDPEVGAAAEKFMRDHAAAKAIVIDCRYNGGGGIVQMNAMLPFLYAKETVLVQMETVEAIVKARGDPWAEDEFIRPASGAAPGIRRSEHYVVPRPDETRLFGAKVFYLTSGRTASAAEHLALAFRHTKRATLIGETTAGANHFGDFEPIGGGLVVFLPVGRTIDPDTGKDWEGTGIAPDVAVAPALALEEALRRASALT